MPPLPRPVEVRTVTLPRRTATVAAETDVLVVGGGPAGLGAALGAAAAGARVVLAERYGFLGGNATAALVMPLMSFHTQRAAPVIPKPIEIAVSSSRLSSSMRTPRAPSGPDGAQITTGPRWLPSPGNPVRTARIPYPGTGTVGTAASNARV